MREEESGGGHDRSPKTSKPSTSPKSVFHAPSQFPLFKLESLTRWEIESLLNVQSIPISTGIDQETGLV